MNKRDLENKQGERESKRKGGAAVLVGSMFVCDSSFCWVSMFLLLLPVSWPSGLFLYCFGEEFPLSLCVTKYD